jgi:cytochrome P450
MSDTLALGRERPHRKRLPPGPHPLRMLLVHGARDRLAFIREIARYGDIAHLRTPRDRLYVIREPRWIKDVLLTHESRYVKAGFDRVKLLLGDGLITSDGALHARQRRLLQPVFRRERLVCHAPTARRSRWPRR